MRVTISQSIELGDIPEYLVEQGQKISAALAQLGERIGGDFQESINQERFLGASNDLENVRLMMNGLDIRVQELQNLCASYQSTLMRLHDEMLQQEQQLAKQSQEMAAGLNPTPAEVEYDDMPPESLDV